MAIEWSIGGINRPCRESMNPAISAATAAEIQPVTQRCGNDRLSPYRLMERHSGMPAQQQNNNSASGIFAQNHVPMLPPG